MIGEKILQSFFMFFKRKNVYLRLEGRVPSVILHSLF